MGRQGGRGKLGSSLPLSCRTQPVGCSWGCGEGLDRLRARGRQGLMEAVCYSLFSPSLVAGCQRAPDPRTASPGCAEAAHTGSVGWGCCIQPRVALMWHRSHHPSTEQTEVVVCFIPTKTETHPSLQEHMPQSQRTMSVLFSSKKNARRQRKEVSCHLFLQANITAFQRKGDV